MLFCHIRSKVPGRKHADLHLTTGLTGLPDMAYLDAQGRWLVRVRSTHRTVPMITTRGKNARTYVELRTRAAQGDQPSAAGYLIMQLEEQQLSHEAALKRRDALDMGQISDAQQAWIKRRLFDLWVFTELKKNGAKPEGRAVSGKTFAKAWADGRQPSPDRSRGWWYAILAHADQSNDLTLFDRAYAGLEKDINTTDKGAAWIPRTLVIYQKIRAKLAERLK